MATCDRLLLIAITRFLSVSQTAWWTIQKLRVFNTVLILLYLQYSVPVEPVSAPGSIVKALFNPPLLLFLNAWVDTEQIRTAGSQIEWEKNMGKPDFNPQTLVRHNTAPAARPPPPRPPAVFKFLLLEGVKPRTFCFDVGGEPTCLPLLKIKFNRCAFSVCHIPFSTDTDSSISAPYISYSFEF